MQIVTWLSGANTTSWRDLPDMWYALWEGTGWTSAAYK